MTGLSLHGYIEHHLVTRLLYNVTFSVWVDACTVALFS